MIDNCQETNHMATADC